MYLFLLIFELHSTIAAMHNIFLMLMRVLSATLGPLPHTSREPWPWNCESPEESVQRPSQDTSEIMYCGHEFPCVEWSHMWLGPQPNAISMDFYSCGFSHIIKRINQRLWVFGVSWSPGFVLGLPPRDVFSKIIQVTMKHDPFRWHVGIHVDFTSILHSHTPLVPRALCEANLDRLRLIHQWECLKCNGHGLSVSCVKWPTGLIRILYWPQYWRTKYPLTSKFTPYEVCSVFKDWIHPFNTHGWDSAKLTSGPWFQNWMSSDMTYNLFI